MEKVDASKSGAGLVVRKKRQIDQISTGPHFSGAGGHLWGILYTESKSVEFQLMYSGTCHFVVSHRLFILNKKNIAQNSVLKT